MSNYYIYYILIIFAISSFLLSLLWTWAIVKNFPMVEIQGIKIKFRNAIDFMMLISRLILPLPFIDQPRFNASIYTMTTGFAIFIMGVSFIILGLKKIYPRLAYNRRIGLVKDGVYGVVRHPIYFGDSIWPLGWSIIFGSIYSILLTPLWFLIYTLTTLYEEKNLLYEYGDEYRKYQKRIKRIIPYIY